jgi:hypothetical protein
VRDFAWWEYSYSHVFKSNVLEVLLVDSGSSLTSRLYAFGEIRAIQERGRDVSEISISLYEIIGLQVH